MVSTKIDVEDGLKIQTSGQEYPYIYFNGRYTGDGI